MESSRNIAFEKGSLNMYIVIWKVEAYISLGLFLLLHITCAWVFPPSLRPRALHGSCAKEDPEHCYEKYFNGETHWMNDCDFPMPTHEQWRLNLPSDLPWLREQFMTYKQLRRGLQKDELTFPTYMLKRYAPNVPPSNMLCDGLGMCMPPSCKDIGRNHDPEIKRRVMLFFESVAGINHSFHILSDAIQDHFRHIHEDIARLTRQFTYADEQQDKAVEKEKKRLKKQQKLEMIFNLIMVATMLLNAALGGLSTFGGMMGDMSAVSKWEPINKFLGPVSGFMGALNGAYIASETLVTTILKNVDHKKDLHGFDKTLDRFHANLTTIDMAQTNRTFHGMSNLVLGKRSFGGRDLIDLYRSKFFNGADVHLRSELYLQMEMRNYGAIIDALWRIEGVYIVESWAEDGGNCDEDTRGPSKGKVCLEERPDRSYWLQAITNFRDKKIHSPPGLDSFNSSFHGISLNDIVRSSLWFIEVYGPMRDSLASDPDNEHNELDNKPAEEPPSKPASKEKRGVSISDYESTTMNETELLDDYGSIPGIFRIPICHSWHGQAISTTNNTHNANAPCHCDPPDPKLAKDWENADDRTMESTKKAVKDGEWHQFSNYGKMCLKRHNCHKSGYWKALLNLPKDVKPAKHMKHAWKGCKSTGHSHHSPGKPQLTESADDSPSDKDQISAQSLEPAREPLVKTTNETISHKFEGNSYTGLNQTLAKGRCLDTLHCKFEEVIRVIETPVSHSVVAPEVHSSENTLYGCIENEEKCIEESAYVACEDLSGDEVSTDEEDGETMDRKENDEDDSENDYLEYPGYDSNEEMNTMKNTGNNRTDCICSQKGIVCNTNGEPITKMVTETREATRTSSKKPSKTAAAEF